MQEYWKTTGLPENQSIVSLPKAGMNVVLPLSQDFLRHHPVTDPRSLAHSCGSDPKRRGKLWAWLWETKDT